MSEKITPFGLIVGLIPDDKHETEPEKKQPEAEKNKVQPKPKIKRV